MSYITVPFPGTEYLCDAVCRHRDCAQHHRDAAAICRLCEKKIGYGRPWIVWNGGQSAHFDCAQERAEERAV